MLACLNTCFEQLLRQTLDNTRFGSFFKPDFAKKSPQTPKISPAARSALAVRPSPPYHMILGVGQLWYVSQHLVSCLNTWCL